MNASEYLLDRLADYKVDHIFGIPGDYILPFFAHAESSGIRMVTTTHEPSAGYAADAYARTRGLGAAVATYGVGALNMLNATAQAYAERSPTLFISGAPEIEGRNPDRLLHHEIKSWDTQIRAFSEMTCAAVNISDKSNACAQIDKVIDEVMRLKRPGYIELPRDMQKADIERRCIVRTYQKKVEDFERILANATAKIIEMLNESKRPVIYAGVEIERFGLRSELIRLAKKANLPVATSLLGKSVFPETHPSFIGIYMGAVGSQRARELVESSDCVLLLGGFMTDFDSGLFTMRFPDENLILADAGQLLIRGEAYPGITLPDIMRSLLLSPGIKPRNPPPKHPDEGAGALHQSAPNNSLSATSIIDALNSFVGDDMAVVTDVGDCLFSCVGLKVNRFIAPAFYASVGFGVPAGLGMGLADLTRRPLILVGDGGFQMTGVELSTAKRMGITPIVIVYNDGKYGTLEAMRPGLRSFDLSIWDYSAIAKAIGCDGSAATTPQELNAALQCALSSKTPYVIDAKISGDRSSTLQRLGSLIGKKTG
jgi:indolepyruvate decarboxylase